MKQTICIASNNAHKIEEFKQMIGHLFELKTLNDIGFTGDIDETEITFEGNSRLKANYIYEKYGVNCIADDSGLEVFALNMEPGVYSARYAGEHGNHAKNVEKLLENLEGNSNRKAQFRTVITLILNGGTQVFEGIVSGTITETQKGNGGFGYDPVFMPEGHEITFAEMPMENKNKISHRGRAIEKMTEYLTHSIGTLN